MGGKGGIWEIILRLQSYSFCHLGPHAKFQNRSLPPSGLFLVGEGGDYVDNKGFLSHCWGLSWGLWLRLANMCYAPHLWQFLSWHQNKGIDKIMWLKACPFSFPNILVLIWAHSLADRHLALILISSEIWGIRKSFWIMYTLYYDGKIAYYLW